MKISCTKDKNHKIFIKEKNSHDTWTYLMDDNGEEIKEQDYNEVVEEDSPNEWVCAICGASVEVKDN